MIGHVVWALDGVIRASKIEALVVGDGKMAVSPEGWPQASSRVRRAGVVVHLWVRAEVFAAFPLSLLGPSESLRLTLYPRNTIKTQLSPIQNFE